MDNSTRFSRRACLRLVGTGLGLAGLGVMAACTGRAPAASPTTAPAAQSASGAATSAASGAPRRGGTLNIGQDFGPQSLDPTKYSAWASTNVAELIYTGMLRWNKDMQLEPDLAQTWDMTPDGKTYTFHLRQGVKFHNGKPFGAEDVKYTIDRIKDPATASPYQAMYAPVESVEVVDPATVRFNLSQPHAALLRYLATIPQGAIVPKDSGDGLEKQPIGTGAFVFKDYVLDQSVRLDRNPDYYEEGLPHLDGVQFKLLGDDTSISSALRSGAVDITWLKDPKVAQNVAKTTKGINSTPGVSSRYIPIFFKLTQKPFDDARVRQAMSVALNRKQIVDTVLGGFGSVGTFLPPSQLAGYKGDGSDLPFYTQDIARAKQLLADAGYGSGLQIPEFKIVAANALDVQCAQLMKEQWAAAGIDVTINPMEVGAILKDWTGGNYIMSMVGTTWAADPDAEVSRFYSKDPFGKAMGIKDADLDKLIEAGRVETDDQKREAIYKNIERRVLEQAYTVVPYTYPLRWELTWDYVKGYDVTASNARMSLRKTYIEKA